MSRYFRLWERGTLAAPTEFLLRFTAVVSLSIAAANAEAVWATAKNSLSPL